MWALYHEIVRKKKKVAQVLGLALRYETLHWQRQILRRQP